jgi:hypothetical protein
LTIGGSPVNSRACPAGWNHARSAKKNTAEVRWPEELERSIITGHRWWTAAQVRASDEPVFPAGLAGLIDQLLRGGPAAPVRLPRRALS